MALETLHMFESIRVTHEYIDCRFKRVTTLELCKIQLNLLSLVHLTQNEAIPGRSVSIPDSWYWALRFYYFSLAFWVIYALCTLQHFPYFFYSLYAYTYVSVPDTRHVMVGPVFCIGFNTAIIPPLRFLCLQDPPLPLWRFDFQVGGAGYKFSRE